MQTRKVCPAVLRGTTVCCLALASLIGPVPSALAASPFASSEDDWLRRVRGSSGDRRLVVDSFAANTPGTLFLWSEDGEEGGPDLEEPIVTDRPDFTEASSTVGAGVFQIESGYTYTKDTEAGVATRSHSYPETLLRYGVVANWLELRLAWNYGQEHSLFEHTVDATQLYLGAKIGLTPQDGWLPEMALVPQMTVPTGAGAFSDDEVHPGVNWLYGWDVNDFISTAGSTQVNRAIDDDTGADYAEWSQSWTVGYTLNDKLGAYTEWFAHFPHNGDAAATQHYFDGGFTYKFTNDVQWDIRAGVGLNDAADDAFIGTGLSIRFQ